MNTLISNQTVGEIATQNPSAIAVFEKYNIDYCCHGKQNLANACQRAAVSQQEVESALALTRTDSLNTQLRTADWTLDLLVDYIIQNHHSYINTVTPEIHFLTDKVLSEHGRQHPELYDIKDVFHNLSDELTSHMAKEEKILFPRIRQMAKAMKTSGWSDNGFRMQGPIDVMEHEHDVAGAYLTELRQLTKNYTLPEDACQSYALLYQRLQQFEQDLHTHIHLENNILFTKAISIEQNSTQELV